MRRFLFILSFIFVAQLVFAGGSDFFFFTENGDVVKEYSLYPNPSSGVFTVQLESAQPSTNPLKLKVYSLIGQEMYQTQLQAFQGRAEFEINLADLPKGIYMIEISNGEQSQTKRLSLI